MKLFVWSLSIFWSVLADGESITYTSIDEVYGAHNLTRKVLSRSALRARKYVKSGLITDEEYVKTRKPTNCVFPVSIHLLIDATVSMSGAPEQTVLDAIDGLDAYVAKHPGSKLSLSTFRDKPVEGLGEADDYCVKTLVENGSVDDVADAYQGVLSYGGGDWLNDHFGALAQVLHADSAWLEDKDSTHVVLLLTNSAPHFKHDGGDAHYSYLAEVTNTTELTEANCATTYYPSPRVIRNLLDQTNTYLAVVVLDEETEERWSYETFEWLNAFVGQNSDMLAGSPNDAETLSDAMNRVLSGLNQAVCGVTASSSASDLTSSTVTEPTTCAQPDTAECLGCVSNVGCCKAPGSTPKLFVVLNEPPKQLTIKGEIGSGSGVNVIDLTNVA